MQPRAIPRPPIRVAFVLHVMQVAGAEMLVAEIIRRLGDRLDPVVLCLDHIGPLGTTLQAGGVPVIALGRRPGLDLGVARRLARELRDRHIEVVHAHQYTPFFYTALARLAVHHPVHVMFTEHGRHYPDVVSRRRRLANRMVLARLADEVNAVCRFSARSLADVDGFSARQIEVIANGIEVPSERTPQERLDLRLALGLAPDRKYVVSVARFHPVKDHATLLRAFSIVAASRPDVDLLLAGDGPLRLDLESLARTLGLAGRVRFLGVRHDVPDLLAACDAFTLASVTEAASLTLLEAMAASLPVVVTDVGGNPEIVEHEVTGLLVPRGVPHAVAAALHSVLGNRALSQSLGRAARVKVARDYQLDRTIRTYGERYEGAARRLRQAVVRRRPVLVRP